MNTADTPRTCKKCGTPFPSTDKHDLCVDCRRKRIAKAKDAVLSGAKVAPAFGIGGIVYAIYKYRKKD